MAEEATVTMRGKGLLLVLFPTTIGALCGCTVHVEPAAPPPVAVDVDPGPVVYDDYYWRGYYDGPYFFWYGRDGHLFHELREEHEHRERFEHRPHGLERHGTPERQRFEREQGHRGEHEEHR
jgi:hypothetical protein